MSSNSAPPASSDHDSDDSNEAVLSLGELIESEEKMVNDAAAVLGAGSDKKCSYTEGYLKRQALYSCLTCIPETKEDPAKGAGLCLACSYHCHDGHELVELYTKRNFRCDCGNSKFTNVKCNLLNTKNDVNELNNYNQNFSGLYCVCHRPYPDAEDPLPDEMIQCIVCEDWYHTRHLGAEVPSNSFAEMICGTCVAKHEFLLHYDSLNPSKLESGEVNVVDEVKEESSAAKDESETTPAVEGSNKCCKPVAKSEKSGTKFWLDISWRQDLCTCPDCLEMYKKENVSFLIDSEDSVQVYEEKGKANAKEYLDSYDKNVSNSLKSMDRVALVEFIAGYNDLKENLGEYLKKFASNKKIVRVEDIKEFFEGMKARKKQKIGEGCPPAHCR